jgi:predicted amidohydrolase
MVHRWFTVESMRIRLREPMQIAVVQPPCVSYDVGANAVAHAAAVRAAGARVVVFTETLPS